MMTWVLLSALGVVAGTIGGLIGFGSSIMLLPALVFTVGPKETIPIMAISGLMANLSRVVVWWRVVDWRAAGVYSATAIPAAAFGALTLIQLDAKKLEVGLALFLLAMIPIRRWLLARGLTIKLWHLAIVGACIGFLAGIVATTGPINTPFFLAYGLAKGPFVATEAAGSALIGLTKSSVFRTFGALPWETLVRGLVIGSALTVGSWVSKRLMQHITTEQFHGMMDGVLFFAGIILLIGAIWF
ncbi:MAG: hypothetical protein RL291_1535 [Pseudomonadota bacterium]